MSVRRLSGTAVCGPDRTRNGQPSEPSFGTVPMALVARPVPSSDAIFGNCVAR
jgi:hypothetical protein